MLSIKEIRKWANLGLVSERFDPKTGYSIFNYTAKCQYDGVWNDITMKCRGLIMSQDGEIIARPFEKFFNLGELDSVPSGGVDRDWETLSTPF